MVGHPKYKLIDGNFGKSRCSYSSADVKTLTEKAKSATVEKEFDDAIALYSKAILQTVHAADAAAVSELALLFASRASCFFERGEFLLAEADADRCIKLDPTFPEGYPHGCFF